MKDGGKLGRAASKIEIIIAACLFIAMLITCGMYIDVKINGKTSSLPELSENDKKNLLQTVASENVIYSDDLLEPVFIGVKNGDSMIAALPNDTARRSIENSVYNVIFSLFSGSSQVPEFDENNTSEDYIQKLKRADKYMLISFYSDIPSGVFLPCVSQTAVEEMPSRAFMVKNIFLMPDENGNLYGVCVSSDNKVCVLTPNESVEFNKISAQTYDISDGYSYFEFEEKGGISPVLTSSFPANKYKVDVVSSLEGKEKSSEWIEELFDIFSINTSLVKEFSSKNETAINYIDSEKELVVSDDGSVEFFVSEGNGIYIEEFLGYIPESGKAFSFNEKILAAKTIVNRLKAVTTGFSYSIIGVDYDKDTDIMQLYLKYMIDGIMVSHRKYDALFKMTGDSLSYAYFYAERCSRIDDYTVVLPQKYSNQLIDSSSDGNNEILCSVLSKENDSDNTYVLKWAKITPSTEVEK